MGNCLVLQEKAIKVLKTDGKVLEYKAPIKVHQLLSEFAGHAISDTIPVFRHLRPDTELLGGHLYYLLPLPVLVPPPESDKKMLRFSNPQLEPGQGTGVVRIKLVISKQELEVMLRKGGVSIDDLVSQLQNKQNGANKFDDENGKWKGWKPVLESIPEVN
uniref:Uncharacterized protein n=1 Tax=Davidia involucrata TaxID=16924 RepID=A0A5B6ZBW8_DAVIN